MLHARQERREQRPHCRPDIAAHLEHGLRKPVPTTRRHPRHARGLRMEHGGPGADQRSRHEQHEKIVRVGKQHEPDERCLRECARAGSRVVQDSLDRPRYPAELRAPLVPPAAQYA